VTSLFPSLRPACTLTESTGASHLDDAAPDACRAPAHVGLKNRTLAAIYVYYDHHRYEIPGQPALPIGPSAEGNDRPQEPLHIVPCPDPQSRPGDRQPVD